MILLMARCGLGAVKNIDVHKLFADPELSLRRLALPPEGIDWGGEVVIGWQNLGQSFGILEGGFHIATVPAKT
jgi:hypothetical protein